MEWERKIENNKIVGATWKGFDKNGNPKKGTVPTVAVETSDGNLKLYTSNKEKQLGSIKLINKNKYNMVELPLPKDVGNIYEVYNRTGNDQWGSAKGIAALINAAVDFNQEYNGEKLSFGDIKSPFGGSVAYSGGIHHKGNSFQVDMRLLSNYGGSEKEIGMILILVLIDLYFYLIQ
ncbi:MAG: hypothetical protein Kow0079_17370 [Vicingaceae bacterium]